MPLILNQGLPFKYNQIMLQNIALDQKYSGQLTNEIIGTGPSKDNLPLKQAKPKVQSEKESELPKTSMNYLMLSIQILFKELKQLQQLLEIILLHMLMRIIGFQSIPFIVSKLSLLNDKRMTFKLMRFHGRQVMQIIKQYSS
ncbi:unnamed protein product [Paramecium octaurelia]|uniref:Uncharacterized protein n=1 Tax=Paramecium octaurelia TaxID=43137 RepID=A0A8S1V7R1_PAROT|nr:unnamed protein product [Paramecium octaurelia]